MKRDELEHVIRAAANVAGDPNLGDSPNASRYHPSIS